MERFTRRTHTIHPSQKPTYILSSDNKEVIHKFEGSSCNDTYTGKAVDKLGRYEDIGTVEEFATLKMAKK